MQLLNHLGAVISPVYVLSIIERIASELMLFAACGFLIGGVGDILVDFIWIGRTAWRNFTVYRTHPRSDASMLPAPRRDAPIAVFVPAWDESAVIAEMLSNTLRSWEGTNWTIFVGTYINDPATRAAVASVHSPRILSILTDRRGPTTKADCLNLLWRAMIAEERTLGHQYKAIVLHDAEDVVHADEITVFDSLIERFDLVQLPVLPLADPQSPWVGGHYLDEFAESHSKTLVVREALGAAVPAAGVGCAISRSMMQKIADKQHGVPFQADSLTEDYELGLRIHALGGRGAFVRLPDRAGGNLVAVRAHFPTTIAAAARQKARWIVGIALSGWDRLGWRGGLIERWMQLQDRIAPFAALVMLAAYAAAALTAVTGGVRWFTGTQADVPFSAALAIGLTLCLFLLIWRLAMRALFVGRIYGRAEALRAIPRAFIGNFIAILAARRAVSLYISIRQSGQVRWDKTAHRFPAS